MVEVTMPKMGDAMEEGTLVEWLKKEGEKVAEGEPIASIQTDKATVEMESPGTGTLAGFLIQEGDSVPVGEPIALVLGDGESVPDGWGAGKEREAAPSPAPAKAHKREQHTERPGAQTTTAVVEAPDGNGERVIASPLARKLARQKGVNLRSLRGSGPGGRIIEKDVLAAAEGTGAKPPAKPAPAASARPAALEAREVPLTNLQRITAQRTAESKQTIPHYYVTVDCDVEELQRLRAWMNEENPDEKLSLNDFIVKACAMALVEQPHINASFQDGKRHEYSEVNIGVLTAVEDGLTLPVVKNCESKSLRALALEVKQMVQKARDNRLTPDELTGATFVVSNMGMYDVDSFAAVINQPNGAVVAVGTAKRVAVVLEENGKEVIGPRWRMKMTGSFDHRIIDGAVGAKFLRAVRKYLESPTLLLA